MMRFVMPTILIAISVTLFFLFSNPLYNDISALRAKADSYNEALGNSKALENARDALTAKKNSIKPENLDKLQKLLPENIDNIRLILEIEKIAAPYGMTLKDVKYSSSEGEAAKGPTPGAAAVAPPTSQAMVPTSRSTTIKKDYGVWELSFSTSGSYNNFLNFTKDLETNLRIVDISSIQFSSASSSSGSNQSGAYKYDFKIKTYWLKK